MNSFDMKIDYHSHILPGIDDGAADIDEALMLAGAIHSWGFDRAYCTPHITHKFRNTPETIRPAFERLCESVRSAKIDIELRMSAEYRIIPETWPEVLEKNWLMPIEDKYILMEFPISKPHKIGHLKPMEEFRKVLSMGLTPILPHPERYLYLSHEDLMSYVDAGVKIQCNYGSLAGIYGSEVQARVRNLISEGIVSFYGTDLHNESYARTLSDWFSRQ